MIEGRAKAHKLSASTWLADRTLLNMKLESEQFESGEIAIIRTNSELCVRSEREPEVDDLTNCGQYVWT